MACESRYQATVLVGLLIANLMICAAAGQPRPMAEVSFVGDAAAYSPGFVSPDFSSKRHASRLAQQHGVNRDGSEFVFVSDDGPQPVGLLERMRRAVENESSGDREKPLLGNPFSNFKLPALLFKNGDARAEGESGASSIAVVDKTRQPAQQQSTRIQDRQVVATGYTMRSRQIQTRPRGKPAERPSLLGFLMKDGSQSSNAPPTSNTGVSRQAAPLPATSPQQSRQTTREASRAGRAANTRKSSSNANTSMNSATNRVSMDAAASTRNAPRSITRRPQPTISLRTSVPSESPRRLASSRQPLPVAMKMPRPSPPALRLEPAAATSLDQMKTERTAAVSERKQPTQNQLVATKQRTATATLQKYSPQSRPRLSRTPTHPAQQLTTAQEHARNLIVKIHKEAHAAQSEEDFTHIIESCRRALAIQPNGEAADYAKQLCAWGLNRRGQFKADRGNEKEAMLDFEDALRFDPELWRAIHNRGVLRAQASQFEAAFDDFNRCTELNPRFAKAYSNRAALFVQARDLLAALQDYRRAIQLDPDLAVAHKGRGRVCHMLGSLEEALFHFDAAAQLTPDDAHVIASRADLLVDLGRYHDAAAEYRQAIDLDNSLAHAHRSSAWLLATCPDSSIRDEGQALSAAERAIDLDELENSISLDTLAAAQANAGDFEAAMTTIARAIEIAPEEERAVYLERLDLYRQAKPYRIQPVSPVSQANFQQ